MLSLSAPGRKLSRPVASGFRRRWQGCPRTCSGVCSVLCAAGCKFRHESRQSGRQVAGTFGMNIVVSGASGFIGSSLVPHLESEGHQVTRLVRRRPLAASGEIFWDPAIGEIDRAGLEGTEAAVHLAGESLSRGRWTRRKKGRILDSRSQGTRLLATTLAGLTPLPKVLVSASAIGYYGDRGDEELTEESTPGVGFLAEVCRAWEEAAAPAEEAGIRVVHPRFGLVLGDGGGALQKMLLPFSLGVGGRLGAGHQQWSWISLVDHVRALAFVLAREDISGPVNLVAPHPVSNRVFTKTLGRVLRRPTVFPLPAALLRLMFGEVADEMLLSGARVLPGKLLAAGFTFRQPDVEGALREALRRPE